MKNKGYITVFLSLILVAMLVVIYAVIDISDRSNAKTKSYAAVSSACSGELAAYNRTVYDRYHILLLDKNMSGRGEGCIEQNIKNSLEYDLGDEYSVDSVEISGMVGIMDDDFSEFKTQIRDYIPYEAAEFGLDKLLDGMKDKEESLDQETVDAMDKDVDSHKTDTSDNSDNHVAFTEGDNASEEGDQSDSEPVKDPRETVKTYVDAGIEQLIMPADVEMSGRTADLSELPSEGKSGIFLGNINTDFDDYNQMKLDLTPEKGLLTDLGDDAMAIAYAAENFSCLTDKKYDDTYFNFEMEYLIAGKDTDGGNFKTVIDEILAIRLGVNMAFLITDSAKMAELDGIAAALCIEFPPAQPVVKYLLAGCWAYIESVADCYLIVRGHKIPYTKDTTNWVTDLESLGHLDELTHVSEDETGLGYKEYLMLLLMLHRDTIYYRMSDLIELNVGIQSPELNFKMKNAITAFGVNVDIGYKGSKFHIYEEAGY